MNDVNKTLYIPLYGKAQVSRRGIILHDPKAEEIWEREGFPLKGKSRSKWLALYMGMRSAVFDRWLQIKMDANPDAVILHIGCGMDSRIIRVGTRGHEWYDVDFQEVIEHRKKHYGQISGYHMLGADVRKLPWLEELQCSKDAIIVMEGLSMYLKPHELLELFTAIYNRFENVCLLMDCYTQFAATASKYKNPVNEVGVTTLYGIDNPKILESSGFTYVSEHSLTPDDLINELISFEKLFFKKVFAGSVAKKLYRLYEFHSYRRKQL